MVYLRKFKENKEIDLTSELENMAGNYLAYLLDDGEFWIEVYKYNKSFEIFLGHTGFFKWEDVYDYLVPFLTVLNNKYTLGYITIEAAKGNISVTYDEIINKNDKIYNNYIVGIEIKIKSPLN